MQRKAEIGQDVASLWLVNRLATAFGEDFIPTLITYFWKYPLLDFRGQAIVVPTTIPGIPDTQENLFISLFLRLTVFS